MTIYDALDEARENVTNNHSTEPCVIRRLVLEIETMTQNLAVAKRNAVEWERIAMVAGNDAQAMRRRLHIAGLLPNVRRSDTEGRSP